ncbi:MAG: helix-turn-helix domain-containing protein [Alphaproteobacteria bacterium]|nr:helix-turn-helix domain-containing protein [Alphaproteobacteria bacterium]MBU0873228.1 helix-turn-helix domain-containing protein [Alphaproteobacteria bacterium]MBU1400532.1 helix-turn-helix domain-containing protein [Alphaproteobacteria bacterium]MBU1592856.1 helix-turn-helix domain-containing protein [Alphaproteobacteria bacterium]MBU1792366.1 helix-turn-helix domain-containing protein [Alphaproteobacteria bacterium]
MRTADLPEVRSLGLFESMDESNFDALVQAAYLQTFPAQLDLIAEGDPADFLHVVIEGCVELYARANGRESTMGMVRPVGTFILAAVLKDAVYLMSARTCQKSKVLLIPVEDVRRAFRADEAFARAIVLELAGCYRAVVKEHKDIKLRTAIERLANRLIRYHRDQGETGRVELPYDKRTMASLLGMTPENLSRAFNTLKPYGVDVDGTTIRLNDMKALNGLAKPNHLIDDRTT